MAPPVPDCSCAPFCYEEEVGPGVSYWECCKDPCQNETPQCDKGYCYGLHGGWSDWSDWSPCACKLFGSTHTRDRSCSNPTPNTTYFGKPCSGHRTESRDCELEYCPVWIGVVIGLSVLLFLIFILATVAVWRWRKRLEKNGSEQRGSPCPWVYNRWRLRQSRPQRHQWGHPQMRQSWVEKGKMNHLSPKIRENHSFFFLGTH